MMGSKISNITSTIKSESENIQLIWHSWENSTFEKAKKLNKPILMVVGYYNCYWCNVMDKDILLHDDLKLYLSKYFILIKIDKDIRPDIDHIYMSICQIVNQYGGWPLSVFMSYDKKPFYITTYLNISDTKEQVGFSSLVKGIIYSWNEKKSEVLSVSEEISNNFIQMYYPYNSIKVDFKDTSSLQIPSKKEISSYISSAMSNFKENFDHSNGGFMDFPKFPQAGILLFLIDFIKNPINSKDIKEIDCAKLMLKKTLRKMREGGIYDHIGFGFHRYSTDRNWLVPHFEKMLIDQALFIEIYSLGFQETNIELFKETVNEVIKYIKHNLLNSNNNMCYNSQGSNIENTYNKFEFTDGLYYLWSYDEIKNTLKDKKDIELATKYFNIKSNGNFQYTEHNSKSSLNILNTLKFKKPKTNNLSNSKLDKQKIEEIRIKLLNKRKTKKHLIKTDNHILTISNIILANSLIIASDINNNDKSLLNWSIQIVDYIINNLYDIELDIVYHDINKSTKGYLDTYAFLIKVMLKLYNITNKNNYIKISYRLIDIIQKYFWDKDKLLYLYSDQRFKKSSELIIEPHISHDINLNSSISTHLNNLIELYKINKLYQEEIKILISTYKFLYKEEPHFYTKTLYNIFLYKDFYYINQ